MSFSKKGESVNGAEDLHLTMAMEEVNLMKIILKCTGVLYITLITQFCDYSLLPHMSVEVSQFCQ